MSDGEKNDCWTAASEGDGETGSDGNDDEWEPAIPETHVPEDVCAVSKEAREWK